ncbi:hypothetical protein D1007_56866 [Hordeum vulgare]|nr:hypothetical protein D1007_56866 [Hordeum vulgare]
MEPGAEEAIHSRADATPTNREGFEEEGTGSGSHVPTPSPTSMPLRLQPPSTGQVPGCRSSQSSMPGYKVGHARGRGGATPATAAASVQHHSGNEKGNKASNLVKSSSLFLNVLIRSVNE